MSITRRMTAFTAVLVLTLLGAAGNAAAITKTFAVELTPQVAPAADSIVYSAKITNTLTPQNQQLGSVDLTVPAEWDVLGTSAGTVAGNVVQLRDLALAPNKSKVVDVEVDTSAVAGTWAWTARGKQANDFRGDGNDFVLDRLRSDLEVEVEPSDAADVECGEEPTTTEDTTCRTSVTWRGVGPINDDGTPVANDTLPSLLGGTPAPANGDASRDAAVSAAAVTQTSFSVTVSVVANPALVANAGVLTLRLPAQGINCEGNSETSPVSALVNGPANRTKTVTFAVDAGVALAAASQGMCFAGPVPFVPNPLAPVSTPILYGGQPWTQGTLPDCFDGTAGAALQGVTPCRTFAGNEGGNNRSSVLMPLTYPDPTFRP